MSDTTTGAASDLPPSWDNIVTRTTAILAILAALSSGRWGASNLNAILEQGKVNEGWSYYQAKSVKEHIARRTRGLADALGPVHSGALAAFEAEMDAEVVRLENDKLVVYEKTLRYEALRNHHVKASFWFEISFATLQVGVILSTIAAATRKRTFWKAAIVLGVVGIVLVVNGFFHWVEPPDMSNAFAPEFGHSAFATPK